MVKFFLKLIQIPYPVKIIKSFERQDYLFEEMILLDVVNKFFFHFLKGSSLEMLWKK